ncbi:MAG: DUF5337 domain-containing protein [Roseovarius sp.]|nr:DUF5337 domain-containing protein [Roseovarius sp.]
MPQQDQQIARLGRRTALVIAGTGALWVLASLIGAEYGLSQRVRVLFDLMALGGFVYAFVLIHQLWRARQGNRR